MAGDDIGRAIFGGLTPSDFEGTHACDRCDWWGYVPPEIDRKGRHLTARGKRCDGAIIFAPSNRSDASDDSEAAR